MKKLIAFAGLCAYMVGSIGGFGYAVYSRAYFIAACVLALAVMAFPTFKSFWKELNS